MSAADAIREQLETLAQEITDRHFEAWPEHVMRYGAIGRTRCLEDARFHLQYLAIALDANSQSMFLDYIAWTKVLLASRNIPDTDLMRNLEITAGALASKLGDAAADALPLLYAAVAAIPSMPADTPSVLDPRSPLWPIANEYLSALLRGSRGDAARVIHDAVRDGASVRDIYRNVFEPVQQEIGRLWQLNQISVAQEHFCTAATQHVMTQLYTHLFGGEKRDKRAVAMCVGGELHEIGLRIVTDLLEMDGWQTWYLGASVPPAAAVQLCVDQKADVLLVSATLPPHIAAVRAVIQTFRSRPELDGAKVIVGGRAFRSAPDLWRDIGADGYAANADECVALLDKVS